MVRADVAGVEAANIPWRPLGELFVARGLISGEDLEQALAEQAATNERLGEILVRRNLISSPELTEALMEQLGREVATEEGFGSGLWAEIQRRRARPESAPPPKSPPRESPPPLALVDKTPPPFGGALGEALEEGALDDGAVDELEQEIEELKSELGVVAPMPSPPVPAVDPGVEIRAELEQVRQELQTRTATVESLTSELEQARNSLDAREQNFAEELEKWKQTSGETDVLRQSLSERESRLAELETELERALGEREGRIEELQSTLARLETDRDAANGRLAAAEAHAAEVERALREIAGRPGAGARAAARGHPGPCRRARRKIVGASAADRGRGGVAGRGARCARADAASAG